MLQKIGLTSFFKRSIMNSNLFSNFFGSRDLLNFIDGKSVPQNGRSSINVLSPHDNKFISKFNVSDSSDVNLAVKSSLTSFREFSKTTYAQRSTILRNIADILRKNSADLIQIETLDSGKILKETKDDVYSAADCFEYYSACALSIKETYLPLNETSYALTIREPLGVVVGIGAWNFPIANAAWKLAPALCMGNSVIYKPSQLTPLSALLLASLSCEAGLPPGVFNVVLGDGKTGEMLCTHPDVAKVSFTGSVCTGKKILQSCSDPIKRVTLELGGKSPFIIFEDASIKDAVNGAILANFTSQGQICSNATRVYVHESIYDQFKAALLSETKKIKPGNPFLESSNSGAVISQAHLDSVVAYIEGAKSEGATVLYGGEKVTPSDPELSKGCYITPCIMENVSDDMKITKEEVFGPVLCLYKFKTEEEALKRANDTVFGLAGGFYTRDASRIHRISKQLDASTIYVNTYNMYHINTPFGGRKQSGYGRENGEAALDNLSDLKTIIVECGETPQF